MHMEIFFWVPFRREAGKSVCNWFNLIVSISQQHSQCFVFSWLDNFSTNLITEACWGLDVEAASPVWVATAPMPNERLSLGMSAYRLLKGCFGKIYFIHTHCKFHKTLTWKKIISEHQVARFHIISLFGLIQPILQCIDILASLFWPISNCSF